MQTETCAHACFLSPIAHQYADLDYQGGGIGEYQFYDRKNGQWVSSSCQEHGDGRCAMMDCHLPNTHFSLLGYFKEPNFGQWMEQLFKHEGVCVWTDDEYQFMQEERVAWPQYCTPSSSTDEDGNALYFDVRPIDNGLIDMGLYTDSRCSVDYLGSITVNEVLETYYSDDDDVNPYELSESISMWNAAFEIFTICQPCKAYNLGYIPDNQYNQDNRDHQDEDDENEGYFACDDDAGYHNVNQCMKFKTKTEMRQASIEDVMLAAEQGTTTQLKVGDYTYTGHSGGGYLTAGNNHAEMCFLGASILILLTGIWMVWRAYRRSREMNASYQEPLMPSDGVAA